MSLITDHILTWVTFLPLAGSILLWLFIRRDNAARIFALSKSIGKPDQDVVGLNIGGVSREIPFRKIAESVKARA